MSSVRINVAGLGATLTALQATRVRMDVAARAAVEGAGKAFAARVRARISLRDHTLRDLAKLGHPYARRHGTIRVHSNAPWSVHSQSGAALSAFRSGPTVIGGQPGYEVTFDYSVAPHMRYVILGTRVMLPRDVLWLTGQEPETKKAMMRGIVRVLGKELRTKMAIRFDRLAKTPSAGGSTVVR